MALADWTTMVDGMDAASMKRGVTGAEPRPPGGGSFVYGMRSTVETTGAAGLITNQADFAPITPGAGGPPVSIGGGSVRGAIKRGTSTISTGFAPMFWIGLQSGGPTPSVNDNAYVIGLEDSNPHRVVVRKGRIIDGVPAASPTNSLMRSIETELINTYWHLRLDMIVNPSGDVVLRVYKNDLSANDVTAPVWEELEMDGANDGVNGFIDDVLGAASGSVPYDQGWIGFAMKNEGQTKRSYWDHIEVLRQV